MNQDNVGTVAVSTNIGVFFYIFTDDYFTTLLPPVDLSRACYQGDPSPRAGVNRRPAAPCPAPSPGPATGLGLVALMRFLPTGLFALLWLLH